MHVDLYEQAASRLQLSLSKHNLTIKDEKALAISLALFFSEPDMELAENLLNEDLSAVEWHYIRTPLTSEFSHFSLGSHMVVCKSLAIALTVVGVQIDLSHKYPYAISKGDVIQFYLDGELVSEIGKINFMEVDKGIEESISKAVKGISKFNDSERLQSRLSKIPGYELIEIKGVNGKAVQDKHKVTMLENFPLAMIKMLERSHNEIVKQSLALELVANTFGFDNWNLMKSKYEKFNDRIFHPFTISYDDKKKGTNYTFFRNNIEALAGLINFKSDGDKYLMDERQLLTESSDGLKLRMIIEKKSKRTGYFIDAADFVEPKFDVPPEFSGQTFTSYTSAAHVINSYIGFGKTFEEQLIASNKRVKEKTLIFKDTAITKKIDGRLLLQALNGSNSGVIDDDAGIFRSIFGDDYNKGSIYEDNVDLGTSEALFVVLKTKAVLYDSPGGYKAWEFKRISDEEVIKLSKFTKLPIEWREPEKREKYNLDNTK